MILIASHRFSNLSPVFIPSLFLLSSQNGNSNLLYNIIWFLIFITYKNNIIPFKTFSKYNSIVFLQTRKQNLLHASSYRIYILYFWEGLTSWQRKRIFFWERVKNDIFFFSFFLFFSSFVYSFFLPWGSESSWGILRPAEVRALFLSFFFFLSYLPNALL